MPSTRLLRGAAFASPTLLIALTVTAAPAQAANVPVVQAPAAQAPLTAAQAAALSRDVTDKVIVVFKDQLRNLPDIPRNRAKRGSAVRHAQRGVLAELTATHARNVTGFSLVNAVAATVSRGEATRLAANPAVAQVVPDLPIPVTAAPPVATRHGTAAITPLPGACAPAGKVQLDPEALGNIHAAGTNPSAQGLGYTGAGVTVGFIADGVDTSNPDFIRADGSHVFVDYQDFSGTGTNAPTGGGEAFLDSSSIAAQGRHVYNVAGYGVGLSTPCKVRILGVAPGASLVGLNVFGSSNFAYNSVFLEAINYAVNTDHVNVLNESFGSNPFPDTGSLDLTKMANDAAVAAGVTVTVSSGDAGVTNTIGSPATDPNVISAGATTTYRAYAQTGIGGITAPGVKGWLDNNISGLSSAGFAQDGSTVDVVAPGDLNWALCTPKPKLFGSCTNFSGQPASVELSGGTSESAPLTAGTAALVIQAYEKSHGGQAPSPQVVKRIIVSTAQDIGAPADYQGAGILDAYQAVLAASSYPGATTAAAGHAVLASATQLNALAQPGTREHFAETLTNDGTGSLTLGLSSRTLAPYHAVDTQTLSLTAAQGYATEVTFPVPPGQARLNAAMTLAGRAAVSLISPSGDLANYDLPQGVGNYGDAQVANPQPGTWTALLATRPPASGAPVSAQFQASTATWRTFGHVSPGTVTLAAGASQTVTLDVTTPARPGDEAGSIVVQSSATSPSFANTTSVPVTLRSLVPAPNPSTTFTGTLTGGNGRSTTTGQTAYYQVDVPGGLKALNASVKTHDPSNTLLAVLINPFGAAVSTAANGLLQTTGGGGSTLQPEVGAQLHALDPTPGVWTLAVDFYNKVSGTAITQPFTVTVNDTPVAASVTGLPDAAGSVAFAGHPVTAKVRITNHGSTPEEYFTDARLSSSVTADLAPQTTAGLILPNLNGTVPTYLVPSHTTSITATTSAAKPVFFDLNWGFGDPDLMSTTGTTATDSYAATDVPNGDWTITPFLVGPTGASAAPPTPATTSMSATMSAFDPTVTSPTGDLWLASTNASAGFTPYVVDPGQSITIPVTIDPSGPVGTKVTGTLYVSDSSFIPGAVTINNLSGNFPEGSDVAAFHYSYTIK